MGSFGGSTTREPALGIFFTANTQFMSTFDLSITYFVNSEDSTTATVSISNPPTSPYPPSPVPFDTTNNTPLTGTTIDPDSLIIYQSGPVGSDYNYYVYLPVQPSTTVSNVQLDITV